MPAEVGLSWRDIQSWMLRHTSFILASGLLGCALVMVSGYFLARQKPVVTSIELALSYPGAEAGRYPDRTRFSPADLITPQGLSTANAVIAEYGDRRLRQALARATTVRFVPLEEPVELEIDESGEEIVRFRGARYLVSLSLPRNFPLPLAAREQFLDALVRSFHDRFVASHLRLPEKLGPDFEQIERSEYAQYPSLLRNGVETLEKVIALKQQQAAEAMVNEAVIEYQALIAGLRALNEFKITDLTYLIEITAPIKDIARARLRYSLQLARAEQALATARREDEFVLTLLERVSQRSDDVRSLLENPATVADMEGGILRQLLASDAYGSLVAKATATGLAVRAAEAEVDRVSQRFRLLVEPTAAERAAETQVRATLDETVATIKSQLEAITTAFRATHQTHQSAVINGTISATGAAREIVSLRRRALEGLLGVFAGAAFATGLALLGVRSGGRTTPTTSPR